MTNLLSRDGTACLELESLLDGRYRVIQVLSTEAWGHIYLAQDTRRPSQPQCVIQHVKPITVEPEYQDAIAHLFVREAAILEKLADHDQIPQLLACFEDEAGFYLVQEFVNGYPLSLELHPEQIWSENEVVHLLLDCLDPLAFAHSQGIRHGNLTAENLVRRVQDGRFVLVSFDSVRQLHLSLLALHGQTIPQTEIGDQGYQAPEQLKGMPCLASDVYAIGMIAIQALTGVHPTLLQTDAKTGKILWRFHGRDGEVSPSSELVAILERMVCHDCNLRYPSAVEALEAVQQLVHAVTIEPVDAVPSLPIAPEPGSLIYPPVQTDLVSTRRFSPAERHGMTLMVGLGIGTVVTATTVGYAFLMSPPDMQDRGPQILEQAKTQYQAGKLPQAISLAESIPFTSQAYTSARDAIDTWQQDWRNATSVYQKMTSALKQDNWQEVLQEAKTLPQNTHWQAKTATLVQQANRLAENDATQLMVKAYGSAIAKDFTSAMDTLKQIPEGTTVYTVAQEKIREYTQKRQVQATAFLQRAYNRAAIHDFEGALTYLKQIHSDTSVYGKAQNKIQEYAKKQKAQLEAWLRKADQQASANRYTAALASLEKIPTGTALDTKVQEKTAEYTDKILVWSDSLVQKANDEAAQKNYADALALLKKVPLGTPSYDDAREKMQEYARQQQQLKEGIPQPDATANLATNNLGQTDSSFRSVYPISGQATPVSHIQNLNPGSYLREISPQ